MKDLAHKTGIEVNGLLTNHSGRKTFAQLMQDADVDEQVIMNITGHQSVEAVRKYKIPNDQQKMDTLQRLISVQDQEKSHIQNITDQEINEPTQQIQDHNVQPLQISQITNRESQDLSINTLSNNNSKEKAGIFNGCHFQNVNFYFK
jgi:hypothetical protein